MDAVVQSPIVILVLCFVDSSTHFLRSRLPGDKPYRRISSCDPKIVQSTNVVLFEFFQYMRRPYCLPCYRPRAAR